MANLARGRSYSRPSWRQRHPDALWMLLLAPLAIYLLVFFVQPIGLFFAQSLRLPHFTLKDYEQALATPTYLIIIWDTLRLSFVVAACCTLIGYPVAFCLTQAERRWLPLLWGAVLLPFWTSVLVRSYAWIVILRVHGILDSMLSALHVPWHPHLLYNNIAVVIGMVHVLLPYMVLTLYGVMREIDLRYVRAAQSLGAPPVSAFWRVYVPLSMPGVTSGFLVVFILSIGFYITPALLGGGNVQMISLQIAEQINELVNWGFGSALSVILVAVVVGIVLVFMRLFDVEAFGLRSRHEEPAPHDAVEAAAGVVEAQRAASGVHLSEFVPTPNPGPAGSPKRYAGATINWRWWGTMAITGGTGVFLVVPVLLVAAMSFSATSYLAFPPKGFSLHWYAAFFGSSQWMDAAGLSLKVAALTAVMSVILGSAGALAFVRGRFLGKSAIYVATLLPMIVPVIVTAVATYFLFARLHLLGNVWGFAIADTVLAIPMVVLIVSAALRGIDVSLERAATILGANPVRAFFTVTLPTIAPALAAGGLFAFITSFDESVIALFLSSITAATLPKVMWDDLRFQVDPTISAISTLLVGVSIVLLVLSAVLLERARKRGTARL